MKRVLWDARAVEELSAIAGYIAKDSPQSAQRVVRYIRDRAQLLETSPELGRAVDGAFFELVLSRYPYILVYEIAGEEVRILAIFHHRQQRP